MLSTSCCAVSDSVLTALWARVESDASLYVDEKGLDTRKYTAELLSSSQHIVVFRNAPAYSSILDTLSLDHWLKRLPNPRALVTISRWRENPQTVMLKDAMRDGLATLESPPGAMSVVNVPDASTRSVFTDHQGQSGLLLNFGASFTAFHYEEAMAPSMSTQLAVGKAVCRKLWFFAPCCPGRKGAGRAAAMSIPLEGTVEQYVMHFLRLRNTIVLCTTTGDSLFVPAGLAHAVLTIWPADSDPHDRISVLAGSTFELDNDACATAEIKFLNLEKPGALRCVTRAFSYANRISCCFLPVLDALVQSPLLFACFGV
jgi:hypothetical protein